MFGRKYYVTLVQISDWINKYNEAIFMFEINFLARIRQTNFYKDIIKKKLLLKYCIKFFVFVSFVIYLFIFWVHLFI